LMAKRFKRYEPEPDRPSERDNGTSGNGEQFSLEKQHERRILSWSPEPEEEFPHDEPPAPPALADEMQQQAHVAAERQSASVLETLPTDEPLVDSTPVREEPVEPVEAVQPVQPVPAASAQPAAVPQAPAKPVLPSRPPQPAAGEEPRRRGRPRGRPRRQVHFHVDPDEELLLLAAARKNGSQQKGLVAALQALQDIEVLRDEIERLRMECERQRVLLADAEAIFRR